MGALKLEDLRYTYDDYKNWKGNWELIEGVPVALSIAPARKHQSLMTEIIPIPKINGIFSGSETVRCTKSRLPMTNDQ